MINDMSKNDSELSKGKHQTDGILLLLGIIYLPLTLTIFIVFFPAYVAGKLCGVDPLKEKTDNYILFCILFLVILFGCIFSIQFHYPQIYKTLHFSNDI